MFSISIFSPFLSCSFQAFAFPLPALFITTLLVFCLQTPRFLQVWLPTRARRGGLGLASHAQGARAKPGTPALGPASRASGGPAPTARLPRFPVWSPGKESLPPCAASREHWEVGPRLLSTAARRQGGNRGDHQPRNPSTVLPCGLPLPHSPLRPPPPPHTAPLWVRSAGGERRATGSLFLSRGPHTSSDANFRHELSGESWATHMFADHLTAWVLDWQLDAPSGRG